MRVWWVYTTVYLCTCVQQVCVASCYLLDTREGGDVSGPNNTKGAVDVCCRLSYHLLLQRNVNKNMGKDHGHGTNVDQANLAMPAIGVTMLHACLTVVGKILQQNISIFQMLVDVLAAKCPN